MWRTLNHDRTTNETFFMEGKVPVEWIFEMQASETLPKSRIFFHFVLVFGTDLDFRNPKKIFHVSHAYVLSIISYGKCSAF